jgi:hypothetical protein
VVNEAGQPVQDAVNTLIYVITKHFVGDPTDYRNNIYDSLEHLRCPTLANFKWYKDIFLSRVLVRSDNSQPYLKEKFIGGLPKYFAYKVRERLLEEGYSNYATTTYGDIINTIKKIGFNLCNDLRLAKELEKDKKKYARQELG